MQILISSPDSSDTRARGHFAAATGSVAVVLGGDAVPLGVEMGCRHGIEWFVRRLGAALIDIFETDGDRKLTQRLAQAIVNVNALHLTSCDLMSSRSPASSLAVAHETGRGQVEFIVLGAAAIILDRPDGVTVIQDNSLEHQVLPAVEPCDQLAQSGPMDEEFGAAPSCLSTNCPKSHRVSTDPDIVHHARTGSFPQRAAQRLALLSGGLARQPLDRGALTWRHLLDVLDVRSSTRFEVDPENAPRVGVDGRYLPRSHVDADATVVLCRFDPVV